jgi:hypothetical protein
MGWVVSYATFGSPLTLIERNTDETRTVMERIIEMYAP